MRASRSLSPIIAALTLVAHARSSHAQSSAPPPAEAVAPSPTVVDAAPQTPTTPPPPTPASVHVASDGAPVQVGFLSRDSEIPEADVIPYACRTPCDVFVLPGTYQLVARGSMGLMHRVVDIRRGAMFTVTPPTSRPLGLALTILGAVFVGGGLATTIVGLAYAGWTGGFGSPGADPGPFLIAGGLAALGGVALLVPGIILIRFSEGTLRSGAHGDPIRDLPASELSAMIAPVREGGAIAVATFTF